MSGHWDTSTFTTEFGQEFEADRGMRLRRRFAWYSGIVGGAFLLLALLDFIDLFAADPTPRPAYAFTAQWFQMVVTLLTGAVYLGALLYVRSRRGTDDMAVRAVFWLLLGYAVLALVSAWLGRYAGAELQSDGTIARNEAIGMVWYWKLLLAHVLASMFLPWTPREAMRPVLPILALNALFVLLSGDGPWVKVFAIAGTPLIAVPGMTICWWRHSRYRDRFAFRALRGRYTEMKRELVDARRIHESLFPRPVLSGPIRFIYRYEPMRQIGGDYLYAFFPPVEGKPGVKNLGDLSLVIVDVTGHGIPAALTVNRLHGELDRIYAEHPESGPGEVLALLNRYVHLTLSSHSVYVTAFCVRVDAEQGAIHYASGGHPPAFLKAVDGTVEQLDSTAFVLGACPGADFKSDPRTLRFGPGDSLVIYTDGAIECRDATGKFFSITGLQKLVALGTPDAAGGWPATVLGAIHRHRFGPPADDTLIVEVHRPLASDLGSIPKSAGVGHRIGATTG
ncbi:MAG: PP2C family protein-serine/threonine phosphatase [Phycisphaerales bacterium]